MRLPVGLVPFAALFLACLAWSGCSQSPGTAASPDAGEPTDPSQLPPPAAGAGVKMVTDAFTVPAGEELQVCYFFKVSDLLQANGMDPTQPLELHRVQVVQKPGSHHMNLFRVRTIVNLDPANGSPQVGIGGVGQCFVSSNWADWPLVANTHYVNAATQGTPDGIGQVAIDLYSMDPSTITAQMGTIFATNQNIRICEGNPTPTYSHSCQISSPSPVTIVGANGHFHSRGVEFDMYTWDGTSTTTPPESDRFYQSLTWSDPPMLHSPGLQQTVAANGGVWFTCSYQWQDPSAATNGVDTCATLNAFDAKKHMTPVAQQDCCYTFGPQVDVNEHCNAFVYYYPKQDNVTCF